MKIETVHVDWWNGYDTLFVTDPPRRPSASEVRKLTTWIKENRPTCYLPIPFEEFLWLAPWRHFPHERWEAMIRGDSLASHVPDFSFEGKKVMDVGCSTGYYSFLAAAAGADKVIAIESYGKAHYLMDQVVKIYGLEETIEVVDKPFHARTPMLRRPEVIIAFSVLPYLGKKEPEQLRKALKAMAKYVGVSFLEMGDGGSELPWCQGDDAFRELFVESGFTTVSSLGSLFASHTNSHRTLWRCDGG